MANPNEVWESRFPGRAQAQDHCGAWIAKSAHGQQSAQGWEIDHIVPVARGGTDALSNLRPLHWRNNDAKGDSLDGQWTCAKTS